MLDSPLDFPRLQNSTIEKLTEPRQQDVAAATVSRRSKILIDTISFVQMSLKGQRRRFGSRSATSVSTPMNRHQQSRLASLKRAKTGIDQLVGVCRGMTPNDTAQIRPRRAARP